MQEDMKPWLIKRGLVSILIFFLLSFPSFSYLFIILSLSYMKRDRDGE